MALGRRHVTDSGPDELIPPRHVEMTLTSLSSKSFYLHILLWTLKQEACQKSRKISHSDAFKFK